MNAVEPEEVLCPYCGRKAELVPGTVVYGNNASPDPVWWCEPCDAWARVIPGSKRFKPIGRLATQALRDWQKIAHQAFDPLWTKRFQRAKREGKRKLAETLFARAHAWLAGKLGIDRKGCRLGFFDEDLCARTVEVCQKYGHELKRQRHWPRVGDSQ